MNSLSTCIIYALVSARSDIETPRAPETMSRVDWTEAQDAENIVKAAK